MKFVKSQEKRKALGVTWMKRYYICSFLQQIFTEPSYVPGTVPGARVIVVEGPAWSLPSRRS